MTTISAATPKNSRMHPAPQLPAALRPAICSLAFSVPLASCSPANAVRNTRLGALRHLLLIGIIDANQIVVLALPMLLPGASSSLRFLNILTKLSPNCRARLSLVIGWTIKTKLIWFPRSLIAASRTPGFCFILATMVELPTPGSGSAMRVGGM